VRVIHGKGIGQIRQTVHAVHLTALRHRADPEKHLLPNSLALEHIRANNLHGLRNLL
jgi:hypothetical protein